MDRNLALEFVRVTEAAAIEAARWIGKGDKKGEKKGDGKGKGDKRGDENGKGKGDGGKDKGKPKGKGECYQLPRMRRGNHWGYSAKPHNEVQRCVGKEID